MVGLGKIFGRPVKNFGRPGQFLNIWKKIRNVREKISEKNPGVKNFGDEGEGSTIETPTHVSNSILANSNGTADRNSRTDNNINDLPIENDAASSPPKACFNVAFQCPAPIRNNQ